MNDQLMTKIFDRELTLEARRNVKKMSNAVPEKQALIAILNTIDDRLNIQIAGMRKENV